MQFVVAAVPCDKGMHKALEHLGTDSLAPEGEGSSDLLLSTACSRMSTRLLIMAYVSPDAHCINASARS